MSGTSEQNSKVKVVAIVAGGGVGQRYGSPAGKQLALVAGRPILAWSTDAVAQAELVDAVVVVCDPDRVAEYEAAVSTSLHTAKPVSFVPGGATRQESVAAGLAAAGDADVIVVHDGARPLVQPAIVDRSVRALLGKSELSGVVVAHPAVDTVKQVDGESIVGTPDRATLWSAQTPQVFWRSALSDALDRAAHDGFTGTDDSSLLERLGAQVDVVEGSRDNIKVTVGEDRAYAEYVLSARQSPTSAE